MVEHHPICQWLEPLGVLEGDRSAFQEELVEKVVRLLQEESHLQAGLSMEATTHQVINFKVANFADADFVLTQLRHFP